MSLSCTSCSSNLAHTQKKASSSNKGSNAISCFLGHLEGRQLEVPKFSPGSLFMEAVKYRLGKERRHNNQTVYCNAARFRGGLASVWWSCLTVLGRGWKKDSPHSAALASQASKPGDMQTKLPSWKTSAMDLSSLACRELLLYSDVING